jgi:predicted nucleotidyltransferase
MVQFNQLLQRIADVGIDFVIIGGVAAVMHGSSYVTRDVDLCVVLSDENIARLRRALADLNPCHRMTSQRLSFLTHPPDGQPVQNLYLQTDAGVVDMLTTVLGVGDFTRLKSAAEELLVDGRMYRVMALEDLIQAKEALGREKDLLAAKELRAIAAKRARNS